MTRFITAQEVEEWIGVSRATILEWMREGKIPGFKLPSGQVRFDPDEIESWLASCRSTPAGGGRLSLVGEKED